MWCNDIPSVLLHALCRSSQRSARLAEQFLLTREASPVAATAIDCYGTCAWSHIPSRGRSSDEIERSNTVFPIAQLCQFVPALQVELALDQQVALLARLSLNECAKSAVDRATTFCNQTAAVGFIGYIALAAWQMQPWQMVQPVQRHPLSWRAAPPAWSTFCIQCAASTIAPRYC